MDFDSLLTPTAEEVAEGAALKWQNHKRFMGTEEKLKRECGHTNGVVSYEEPSLYEKDRPTTRKRRRRIFKALKQHAKKVRLIQLSAERQADPRFKSAELMIKGECLATSGHWTKVEYQPPSSTELESGTSARRQQMRRMIRKHYRAQAFSFAVATTYAAARLSASSRWEMERGTKVGCKLGADKCPCRGVRWDHVFYTWLESDNGDDRRKYWRRCSVCKNGYDKRYGAENMDFFVSNCGKYVNILQKFAEADEDTFTNRERLLISAADIQRGLIPRIKALMDDDDASDEGVAKLKREITDWVRTEHTNFLTEAEARDKDLVDYLRENSRKSRSEAAEFANIVKLFKKLTINTLLVA